MSKHGVKFASNRSNWSTFENSCIMYDGVYDKMVVAGVAKHLSEKVWMDIDGNIVPLMSLTVFSTLSDLSNVSDLSNMQPMYAFNLLAKGGIEM